MQNFLYDDIEWCVSVNQCMTDKIHTIFIDQRQFAVSIPPCLNFKCAHKDIFSCMVLAQIPRNKISTKAMVGLQKSSFLFTTSSRL